MPDPRKVYGPLPEDRGGVAGAIPRSQWSPDERAYADHLDEHDRLALRPDPCEDDTEMMQKLFAMRDHAEAKARTANKLIRALREREQRG